MSRDIRPSVLLWSCGVESWSGRPGEACRGDAAGDWFPLSIFSKWLRREDTGFCAGGEHLFFGRTTESLTMDEPSVFSFAGWSILQASTSTSTGNCSRYVHRPPTSNSHWARPELWKNIGRRPPKKCCKAQKRRRWSRVQRACW